jgi:hypothetical protein
MQLNKTVVTVKVARQFLVVTQRRRTDPNHKLISTFGWRANNLSRVKWQLNGAFKPS